MSRVFFEVKNEKSFAQKLREFNCRWLEPTEKDLFKISALAEPFS
jgi:hypothetical protein